MTVDIETVGRVVLLAGFCTLQLGNEQAVVDLIEPAAVEKVIEGMVNIGITKVWIGLGDDLCSLLMGERVSIRLLTERPLKRDIRIFDPAGECWFVFWWHFWRLV